MLTDIIILLLLLLLAIGLAGAWYVRFRLFLVVPEGTVAFLERKGRHRLTLTEGKHIVSPKDHVRMFSLDGRESRRFLDMRKQQLPLVRLEVVASDGVILQVEVEAEYQVTNAVTVAYNGVNVQDYAVRIIQKAVRKVMFGKDSETIEGYLSDFMEAGARMASRMALFYGFRITVSELRIASDGEPDADYEDGLFDDETEIPDIEEDQSSLPEPAEDTPQWPGAEPEAENPMPEEEDEILDMTSKEHIYVRYTGDIATFNDQRHLQNFMNYLFRSDRNQKHTVELTGRNLCAIRQQDGAFRIYRHEDMATVADRSRLQREAMALLQGTDYYNVINDEVLVSLYQGDIQYLRDYSQLKTLEEQDEIFVFRKLVEKYEKELAPVVICAMHNDQDYGGKRVINHIHRVIIKTIPYERRGVSEEN